EAMLNAHPYEQPVYSVVDTVYKGEYGFGRKGELEKPMTLKEYCVFVKEALNLPVIEYTGNDEKIIKTVGVCSGAGGDMYEQALYLGLDAFITGDIKHHISVLAAQNETALINGGHYGTEAIFKNILCKHLQNRFNELQYNVNIICSSSEKSPWKIL
ncbi:MAG: Nif3-like dinuclear metal center hexameric protein, partial [Clostridia bacterium]|nr:Nif3-like dinuclear metal center hexameric protein [Clostridia bacterium]